MTGISVDLEQMLRSAWDFSGCAEALQNQIQQLEAPIMDLPFGSEIVSQAFTSIYTFGAAWFEEVIKSHFAMLDYADKSLQAWAKQLGLTDQQIADLFGKLKDGIDDLPGTLGAAAGDTASSAANQAGVPLPDLGGLGTESTKPTHFGAQEGSQ